MVEKTQSVTAQPSILVTGAAGRVGSVGFKLVEQLCHKGFPVRAMVRHEDERSQRLKDMGAQVVAGDLTNLSDLHKAINGCKRIYFGMGVSDQYLEALLKTALVCKQYGIDIFVNISQMTDSFRHECISQYRKQAAAISLDG